MTTLVGLHVPGEGTWIGCDTLITGGPQRMTRPTVKWVLGPDGYACAAAGPARAMSVLQDHAVALMKGKPPQNEFRRRVCNALIGEGFVASADGSSDGLGFPIWALSLMLATPAGIWSFDPTMFATQGETGQMIADGSGADFALGADWVSQSLGVSAAARIERAIEAAIAFDEASGGTPWVRLLPAQAPKPGRRKRIPVVVT